jgi:putative transposase
MLYPDLKSLVPDVEAYIRNQREHHRVKTFEEEYRAVIEKHGLQYEERYLFDGEIVG